MRNALLSPPELAAHLDDPDWVIVDCRFDLTRPEAGRAAYDAAHIPGARYADLDRDLSAARGPGTGRHPLPDPDTLAATFGAWGIGPGVRVAAYDADTGMYAARLWWLLRWLGHDAVAVLDGGLRAWREAGLPLSDSVTTCRPRVFEARVADDAWFDSAAVAQLAGDPGWRLLDVRAAPRYAGDIEPIDPVAGHVPGARNYPFERSLDDAGRWRPVADVRAKLEAALERVPPQRTIIMCGSGVTACHVLLAMAACGLDGARLYAGSFSEWIRDPQRPVATGPDP